MLKVEVGKEATFIWQYSPPSGTTLTLERWCKVDSVRQQCTTNILMTKGATNAAPVVASSNTEYGSRTTGIAPSTMKIRDIRLSDDGVFEFSVSFLNGLTWYDRVRLMVLGKCLFLLKCAIL